MYIHRYTKHHALADPEAIELVGARCLVVAAPQAVFIFFGTFKKG